MTFFLLQEYKIYVCSVPYRRQNIIQAWKDCESKWQNLHFWVDSLTDILRQVCIFLVIPTLLYSRLTQAFTKGTIVTVILC